VAEINSNITADTELLTCRGERRDEKVTGGLRRATVVVIAGEADPQCVALPHRIDVSKVERWKLTPSEEAGTEASL